MTKVTADFLVMDNGAPPSPPPTAPPTGTPPPGGGEDPHGIKKIYPDATSNFKERYAALNITSVEDIDFENKPDTDGSMSIVSGDVWEIIGDSAATTEFNVRANLWSPNNDPWLNMEITVFVKARDPPTEIGQHGVQPYGYGGVHSSTGRGGSNPCHGGSMKPRFAFAGYADVRKELCHSAEPNSYTDSQVTNTRLDNAWQFQVGEWNGFKSIIYPASQNEVRVEMWILPHLGTGVSPDLPPPAEQNWQRLILATDNGWMAGAEFNAVCTECGIADGTVFSDGNPIDTPFTDNDGVTHENANVAALRCDNTIIHVFGYSVREISPP